jgi:hypothetical protein
MAEFVALGYVGAVTHLQKNVDVIRAGRVVFKNTKMVDYFGRC